MGIVDIKATAIVVVLVLCGCVDRGAESATIARAGTGAVATVADNPRASADAGPDIETFSGAEVKLTGTTGAASEPARFRWTQIGGAPQVGLSGSKSATVRFTAPLVAASSELRFRLTVTARNGMTAEDDVVVRVLPPVAMSWLRSDGEVIRDEAGRTFVMRGIDYSYNTIGITDDAPFDIDGGDLDRMVAWGANVLRIRLRDVRSGLYAPQPYEEAGYLAGLDRLIHDANARGLYVILAMGGPDLLTAIDKHPVEPLGELAKFFPPMNHNRGQSIGRRQTRWLNYLGRIYTRYRDWPGLMAFDPINEEIALPRQRLDADFMADLHALALIRLRSIDSRHIYIQQTSGWVYQGFLGARGHVLDDANRLFCAKMAGNMQEDEFGDLIQPEERLPRLLEWAAQAGAPPLLCEYNLFDHGSQVSIPQKLNLQRRVLRVLDAHRLGSVRLGYLPLIGGALVMGDDRGREAKFWLSELIRAYPQWIGGALDAVGYDFSTRALSLAATLDGSGDTVLHVPAHPYPQGFAINASNGATLTVGADGAASGAGILWDATSRRAALPPGQGALTATVQALGPSAPAAVVGPDSNPATVTLPNTPRIGNGDLAANLRASGDWNMPQSICIAGRLAIDLPPAQYERLRYNQPISFTVTEEIGQAVLDCVEAP